MATTTHSPGARELDAETVADAHRAGDTLVVAMRADAPLIPPEPIVLSHVSELRIGRGGRTRWRRPPTAAAPGPHVIKVADPRMSSRHARLRQGSAGWLLEDLGSKNGSYLNGSAVSSTRLRDGDVIELGATFFVFRAAALQAGPVRLIADAGASATWAELADERERLDRIARADVPVLICGEAGSGKKVAAHALHQASGRRGGFVTVSCAELGPEAIARWLTGAADPIASAARGGTLVLDDLAALPLAAQAELLRFLDAGEVGSLPGQPSAVELRLVCTSHHDLAELVARGALRADLHRRLAGVELRTTPLRARREDLGLLCAALLRRAAGPRARRIRIQRQAVRALFAHRWPRNVRELDHVLRAALALADDDELRTAHLPLGLVSPRREQERRASTTGRRDRIVSLLVRCRGDVAAVASALHRPRAELERELAELGIDATAFLWTP